MATLTLYNGDCLEIMKDISSNSIDLIICDLPYGCLEPQRKRSEEYIKKVKRGGQKSIQYGGVGRTNTEGGDGKRCVLSVIPEMGGNRKTQGHPTEKPEDIYKWLIERYCPLGGTVLDPTFGSGNSVFTAYALDRNAIGIEKDEKFYKKAEARLEAIL